MRKVVEADQRISSLAAPSASKFAKGGAKAEFGAAGNPDAAGFPTHDSLQMIPKYEAALFNIHRQFRGFVYNYLSGSNLRS